MEWGVVLSLAANALALASGGLAYRRWRKQRLEEARRDHHLKNIRLLIASKHVRRIEVVAVRDGTSADVKRAPEKVLAATGALDAVETDLELLQAVENRQREVRRQLSELPPTSTDLAHEHFFELAEDAPHSWSHTAEARLPDQRAELEDTGLLELAQNPDTAPAVTTFYAALNDIFEKLGPPPAHLTTTNPTGMGDGGKPQ
ncbi:hypothetical protein HYE82_31305 [Streptomyces sp. BR123]|uniref:hypothetical protein n=1 Tax=Streptomyces sp. BR123 TaxID=2749828 RepID=UPI0015C4235C|nr:hypothetical protein [Streptomyces sp. BR123]NXY98789.1 hypothetical protein [Streptomyces sp. BR123]